MSRKIIRKAIDKAYGARRLLASSELKAISAYSMGSFLTLENLNALALGVMERGIPGDFVECGVFNGGSAAAAACAIRSSGRKLWLYDSFEGMPETTAADGPAAADFIGKCVGDEANVHAAMRLARFPEERYVIRKGWFQDTFTTGPMPGSIAFLHIDADWYDSVQLALVTFYDRVSTGGVIILDDFGHWEGCREAFYDFAAERDVKPLLERFGHTQAYWIKDRTHNRI